MIFNSFAFAVFFPIVTILYFLSPFKYKWSLLLAASCFFYMFFKPVYILILGFTILIDYFVGIYLEDIKKQSSRKSLLVISLIANIGILAFFKYFNFIDNNIGALATLFGFKNPIPLLNIILPIGLSFHTFQAMSYTIEVYRKNQKAERHFGYYALYVMYYPQLVAGPIERPQNVLHQFRQNYHFDYDRVSSGLQLMLWGLFKKVVVADTLAFYVNNYYDQCFHTDKNSLVAILFFSFQIYCDFSGYTDIAIGASKVMGISLMKNFNYPYFARTVTDFWRRWHISLSSWFKDYLYVPLGGNDTKYLYIRNVLIVFVISGLWHGANWTFIVWGLIHGVVSVAERLLKISRSRSLLMWILTFTIVSLAWVFFRSDSFAMAIRMFHNLSYASFDFGGDYSNIIRGIVILSLFMTAEHFTYKSGRITLFELIPKKVFRYALYLIMIEWILFSFNKIQSQQFIYFQF